MGDGTGQGVTSTDLNTPATESRTTGTTAQATTTTTNDTVQVTGTMTAGGAKTITEAALFDAAGSGNPPSGGNMGYYADFTGIGLGTGDSIAFTFNIIYDQG